MTVRKSRRTGEPQERLARALGEHMSDDFDAFGAEMIAKLRTEKPIEYMKLMTSILSGAVSEAAAKSKITVIERHIVDPQNPDR